MAQSLRPSVAPNLPIGPVDYDQRYQDQLLNALRLYFRELDNFTQVLMANNGGRFVSFPHISASDTTDQYATANNTPTLVLWNTLETDEGFTLNAPGTATAAYSGVYKIDYSLELANTDNLAHDVVIWLRVDGVDVPRSASKFTLPARKSAGVYSYLVAYSHITFPIYGGSDIALYWATDKAYKTVGPVEGVYIEYQAAKTVPYAHPAIPSAIGTITFVSELAE